MRLRIVDRFVEGLVSANRRFIAKNSPLVVTVAHTVRAVLISEVVTLLICVPLFPEAVALAAAFSGGVPLLVAPPLIYLHARSTQELVAAARRETEHHTRQRVAQEVTRALGLAGIAWARWDLKSGQGRYSDQIWDLLGRPAQDGPTGLELFLEAVHPADRDVFSAEIDRGAQDGGPRAFEHRLMRPDGTVRHVLARAARATDETTGSQTMTLVIQDVTALRDAERELRQAEERMRVIADSLPALVAYVNKDERFDFVNRTYEEWYGMPREQIRHMPVREILGAERYVRLEPLIKRALAERSACRMSASGRPKSSGTAHRS